MSVTRKRKRMHCGEEVTGTHPSVAQQPELNRLTAQRLEQVAKRAKHWAPHVRVRLAGSGTRIGVAPCSASNDWTLKPSFDAGLILGSHAWYLDTDHNGHLGIRRDPTGKVVITEAFISAILKPDARGVAHHKEKLGDLTEEGFIDVHLGHTQAVAGDLHPPVDIPPNVDLGCVATPSSPPSVASASLFALDAVELHCAEFCGEQCEAWHQRSACYAMCSEDLHHCGPHLCEDHTAEEVPPPASAVNKVD